MLTFISELVLNLNDDKYYPICTLVDLSVGSLFISEKKLALLKAKFYTICFHTCTHIFGIV